MKALLAAPAFAFIASCTSLSGSETEIPLVIKTIPLSYVGEVRSKINYTLRNSFPARPGGLQELKMASYQREGGGFVILDCSELNAKWSLAVVNRAHLAISKREQTELDKQIEEFKKGDLALGCHHSVA